MFNPIQTTNFFARVFRHYRHGAYTPHFHRLDDLSGELHAELTAAVRGELNGKKARNVGVILFPRYTPINGARERAMAEFRARRDELRDNPKDGKVGFLTYAKSVGEWYIVEYDYPVSEPKPRREKNPVQEKIPAEKNQPVGDLA